MFEVGQAGRKSPSPPTPALPAESCRLPAAGYSSSFTFRESEALVSWDRVSSSLRRRPASRPRPRPGEPQSRAVQGPAFRLRLPPRDYAARPRPRPRPLAPSPTAETRRPKVLRYPSLRRRLRASQPLDAGGGTSGRSAPAKWRLPWALCRFVFLSVNSGAEASCLYA